MHFFTKAKVKIKWHVSIHVHTSETPFYRNLWPDLNEKLIDKLLEKNHTWDSDITLQGMVFHQEHAEMADTDLQVPVSKLVGDVEAQGTELQSLQHDPVEHTQWEEQIYFNTSTCEWISRDSRRTLEHGHLH